MSEIKVTLAGNVVADPEKKFGKNGVEFAVFRVAANESWRGESGWVDGPTTFMRVTAFGQLGQGVLASLHKGNPVVLTGRLRIGSWTTNTGEVRSSPEINAITVGHDLSKGTAAFVRFTPRVSFDSGSPGGSAGVAGMIGGAGAVGGVDAGREAGGYGRSELPASSRSSQRFGIGQVPSDAWGTPTPSTDDLDHPDFAGLDVDRVTGEVLGPVPDDALDSVSDRVPGELTGETPDAERGQVPAEAEETAQAS